jgi:hypothetical protein
MVKLLPPGVVWLEASELATQLVIVVGITAMVLKELARDC